MVHYLIFTADLKILHNTELTEDMLNDLDLGRIVDIIRVEGKFSFESLREQDR